jgi:hypothetical protein
MPDSDIRSTLVYKIARYTSPLVPGGPFADWREKWQEMQAWCLVAPFAWLAPLLELLADPPEELHMPGDEHDAVSAELTAREQWENSVTLLLHTWCARDPARFVEILGEVVTRVTFPKWLTLVLVGITGSPEHEENLAWLDRR